MLGLKEVSKNMSSRIEIQYTDIVEIMDDVIELLQVVQEEKPGSYDYIQACLMANYDLEQNYIQDQLSVEIKHLSEVIKRLQARIDSLMIDNFNLSNDVIDKTELIENLNGKIFDLLFKIDEAQDLINEKNELLVKLYSRLDK